LALAAVHEKLAGITVHSLVEDAWASIHQAPADLKAAWHLTEATISSTYAYSKELDYILYFYTNRYPQPKEYMTSTNIVQY
jgi:hypothetical protein